jgi:hypothetical protein
MSLQDRESKLRDQIASLEAQLARSRAEADQAKAAAAAAKSTNGSSTHASIPSRPRQNGYTHVTHTPARPDSRASTIYNASRAVTPVAQPNGNHYALSARASSPPAPSVWDSIHAPTARVPTALWSKTSRARPQARIPSPTPSTVSAAPTLGDDGWYH